jgi:hypothetical protein
MTSVAFRWQYVKFFQRWNRIFSGGSSGKLNNKYGKLRHNMNGAKMINSRAYQKQSNSKEAAPEIEHDEVAIEASLQWIKINTDPWPKVLNHWTTSLAAHQALLDSTSVHDYLKMFPCVSDNKFLELVGY